MRLPRARAALPLSLLAATSLLGFAVPGGAATSTTVEVGTTMPTDQPASTTETSQPATTTGSDTHRVYTRTVGLRRGANTIHLRDWLWGRRYRLELVAVDADRNVAKPVRLRIAIR